jgi:hypothetical protein
MNENETTPKYTIQTNHWPSHEGKMLTWCPGIQPAPEWSTTNPAEAVKQIAYFRIAYPNSNWSLHRDGWIVSGKELSELAKHVLLG